MDVPPEDARALIEEVALELEDHGADLGSGDESAGLDISAACPAGYVPIESVTVGRIAERGSLEAFLYDEPPITEDHVHAIVRQEGSFQGGKVHLNIWNPFVERNDEFSLMQVWVVRGVGADWQTVEAGWQDYYGRTLSHKPRLFVWSTSDNYATGCYNANCGDWVQLDNEFPLNMTWTDFSTDGGTQFSDEYTVYRGATSGNWYVSFRGTTMGYYPASLFDSQGLANLAAVVDFGGEVVNRWAGGVHTTTDMGSGAPPRPRMAARGIRTQHDGARQLVYLR